MWTRNNDVSNQNMLKHFIYSSFSKSTTSSLCSLYYRYSSKVSSFFCILSFLVIAISIDQTFYSATHYLAAVWLDSRHDLNTFKEWRWTENFDWIQWSLINHKFDILIKATFQLSFWLWYLHHQWCKKYNVFLSTICKWQSE